MKINRDTILIKIHFFLFFAGLATVLPYITLYGLELGVPIQILGGGHAFILTITVIAKPLLSGLADTFPFVRRWLFLALIFSTAICYSLMSRIPPFGTYANFESAFVYGSGANMSGISSNMYESLHSEHEFTGPVVILPKNSSCVMKSAVSCKISNNLVKLNLLESFGSNSVYSCKPPLPLALSGNVSSVDCKNTEWEGSCSRSVLAETGFWLLALSMIGASVSDSLVYTFSNAILMDSIGPDGNYGQVRAFASFGWGSSGLLTGLLLTAFTPAGQAKNYSVCFIALFCLVVSDGILAFRLKVPALGKSGVVWPKLLPLLKSLEFICLLLFSLMSGVFGAVIFIYLIVLQEEMSVRNNSTENIHLIEGLSIAVSSFCLVPFLWISNDLIKRLGAVRVMSITFLVYTLRFTMLVLIYWYGRVWMSVLVAMLSGPSYGLACPTVITRAGKMAPEGASTTVQGVIGIFFEVLGAAVGSSVSGFLMSTYGLPYTFTVWAVVAAVTMSLHLLYEKYLSIINKKSTPAVIVDGSSLPLKSSTEN